MEDPRAFIYENVFAFETDYSEFSKRCLKIGSQACSARLANLVRLETYYRLVPAERQARCQKTKTSQISIIPRFFWTSHALLMAI